MRYRWVVLIWVLLVSAGMGARAAEPIQIRMMAGPSWGIPPKEATDARSQARRSIFEEFHRQNPGIRIVNAGGLEIKGERADSTFLMSMAGDTAPDVFYVNFRQYYNYIDQGFCRPLDDLIARDPDSISRVHPRIMEVVKSYDQRVYAIPWFQVANGLYYRKDHFQEAGLDPERPPRNWDEFYQFAQKLADSKPGRIGFAFPGGIGNKAYHWTNFVWQAGGEIVLREKGAQMKAAIATPEAAQALDFYRKLVSQTWTRPDGTPGGPAAAISPVLSDDIRQGKVSMWFSYTSDVVLNMNDLPPQLIGIAPMPAGPGGRANEVNAGMWAINARVTDPAQLEACWKFIQFYTSEQAQRISTLRYVELGLASQVSPTMLKKFGFPDLAAQVNPEYVRANESLFESGHPEPYGRNMQQVYVILDSALDRAKLEPQTPALTILQDTAREMDRKLLGYTPREQLQVQRTWAATIFGLILVAVAVWAGQAVRRSRRMQILRSESGASRVVGTDRRRIFRFMTLCLLPASLSILIWAYYPLLRGLVMAFQDYKIVGESQWTGLDNFIAVFTQPIFYKSLWNSFIFVGLTILIGFIIPIFLGIALNELPRLRGFFQTVFYLPAMTSAIVIALLWRQFYAASPDGLLNKLLAPIIGWVNPIWQSLGGNPIPLANDWLGSPTLAMFAVVLPGVWAAAGPGSILYLAALKNIPEERYEAADLDGASWWTKVRWITLPGLRPLILINFLGVFIAGFKAMENIFVLTGGGPLYATHTLGLEIWTNAFMFLKFGYATAAAWVMGSILVGFTLIQIKSLLKMKFSTAKL
ncbi:MAG TPA: extracellular solute-binding protein [Fimbriimonadaceae bacterium]|nr:extracellular solute-binding protein [Fimbriimonadaceae bacterium]